MTVIGIYPEPLRKGQHVGHLRCDYADCWNTVALYHGRGDELPKGWTFVPEVPGTENLLGPLAWRLGRGKHYCPEHVPEPTLPLFAQSAGGSDR